MDFFRKLYDLLRHLGDDAKWRALVDHIGTPKLYVVLFVIVFAETGLVVTPFLPGDSLLFALGAIGARDVGINLPLVTGLLIVAAVLGDAVNYWIGYNLGPAVFRRGGDANLSVPPVTGGPTADPAPRKRSLADRLLNRDHLLKAQSFYERYGGKTIILARFVPVVRTFAPFVAGVGRMSYLRFLAYNVVGGIAWVLVCVGAGLAFGKRQFVKDHFELVIIVIVAISLLPMAIELGRAWLTSRRGGSAVVEGTAVETSDSAAKAD
ncbi:MAG: putative rane protein [Phycisphaerales bacterium]|nr:putative rane protein [Phycisphaerales bacterium]